MEFFENADFSAMTAEGVLLMLVAFLCGLGAGVFRAKSFTGAWFASLRLGLFLGAILASVYAHDLMGRPFEDYWWEWVVGVAPILLGMTLGELVTPKKGKTPADE